VPVIDRYLDAMVKNRAEQLVFRSGAVVNLLVGGATRALSSRPATEEQINTVLTEALGGGYTPGLAGSRTFSYEGAGGSFTIQVEDGQDGLVVKVLTATSSASAGPRPKGATIAPTAAPAAAAQPRRPTTPGAGPAAPTPPPATRPPEPSPRPSASVNVGVAPAPSHMDELFHQMIDMRASDLHLKSNCIPQVRVDGSITPVPGRTPLTSEQLEALIEPIWPERNRTEFKETNDTDFAYNLVGRARMRCNVFRDIAGVGAVFRQIPSKILTAEQLGLPKTVLDMCELDKGLVVVTGPTGSGKSTTLAAMVDWINCNRDDHIITIEDPVEFVHPDKKCLINQREVGTQTKSFKAALRAALREDPDIVLVGEMRDLETVAIAIETAETGHLVFGTLHTNTAPSTIDRLIDQFPTDRQEQIRVMLAESLKGVVAQTLLKKKGGGRVAALEILLVTPAVANLIREGKTFQIASLMQVGRGLGMQVLSDAIFELVKNGIVEPEEAYARSPHKKEMAAMLSKAGIQGHFTDERAAS
jgi:twitching motility protein PilT